MTQPSLRNVRAVDPILTNFSIDYRSAELIGAQVAPDVRTDDQTGTVFNITRDFALRIPTHLQRAPSGAYARSGYTWGTTTFATLEYGIEYPVPAVISAGSQVPIDLQRKATDMATKDLLLDEEVRIADAALNTGSVWQGTDTTLAGTDQWDDYALSNPISDVDAEKTTMLQNVGTLPTTGYMGWQVFVKLKEHPLLLDKYKHTQTGILTQQLVAEALGIPTLLVGIAARNTAAEGATYSASFIWGKHLVLEVKEGVNLESRIGVVNFKWDEQGVAFPRATETYDEPQTRSVIVRSFHHSHVKIVASNYGRRIASAVS